MTAQTRIAHLHARQILDSRGRPTVEVDIMLEGGAFGRAAVPSGASTGTAEAHELRDGDAGSYEGLGVRHAVANANGEIAAALKGRDAADQHALDTLLRALDGTSQLKRLGANAVLGASMAACRAAATAQALPLYRWIAELSGTTALTMPLPMVNILSGGLHAGRGMDVQDFLAIPAGARSMDEAIEFIARVRQAATRIMAERGLTTLLADEGGLSPGFASSDDALDLMVEATERAGLRPGDDISIAIDVAATALKSNEGRYHLAREGRDASMQEMIEMAAGWIDHYPIVSIEDALDEEEWDGWHTLTKRIGNRVQLVGDDFFTTNSERLARGIKTGAANGVLVKLNQNGTLSGTLDVIALARQNGYAPVVSARSGETEDCFIADLAAGTAAGQIKIGSLRCSDRLSKYNQLIRIAEETAAPLARQADVLGRTPATAA